MRNKGVWLIACWLLPISVGAQEWTEIPDAPSFPDGTPQQTRGHGALTSIVGHGIPQPFDRRDAYCIRITEPGAFLATTDGTIANGAGVTFDSRLLLFRPDGAPVLANDNTPGTTGPGSTLVGAATDGTAFVLSQPGEYVLVIAGGNHSPRDQADVDLLSFDVLDEVQGANSSAGVFDHWYGSSTLGFAYTVMLRGAAFCQGELDVVVANVYWNTVCLGDEGSVFDCSNLGPETNTSPGVALGFVDGDPLLDVVLANYFTQRNRVCLGAGDGTFTCGDVSTEANGSRGVALGFVDGDQSLDAVFSNSSSEKNRVCIGSGDGTFTCSDVGPETNSSMGVALGFVDGDRFLDAVFANAYQRNRLCLGSGNGAFTCSDVSTDEDNSRAVALGLVDGDQHVDAIFANATLNDVCLGNGDGTFSCSKMPEWASYGVALGLVNADQILDAIFARDDSRRNRVCLGAGDGTFTCAYVSQESNSTRGVALGLVDGDQHLDAVFVNHSLQKNRVCLGTGDGTFSCGDVSATTRSSDAVALGDVDLFLWLFADGFESGDTSGWSDAVGY